MNKVQTKRYTWIDCTKLLAIIAVVIDHNYMTMYDSRLISQGSFFSVTVFILLSGISSFLSHVNHERKILSFGENLKKTIPLVTQYAIATCIVLVLTNHFFDLKTYLAHLIGFNIAGPYYFILFFLQLKIVTPLLLTWYEFCEKKACNRMWHCFTLIGCFLFSCVFIQFTYVLPVGGAGRFILGGTFFFVYYLGILLAHFNFFAAKKERLKFIFVGSLLSWFGWLFAMYYQKLPFDAIMEPFSGGGIKPAKR